MFLPFSQAQLHSRHNSSPIVISPGYPQSLWWSDGWHRGLGTGCSIFSLILLVSHHFPSAAAFFLLVTSAPAWSLCGPQSLWETHLLSHGAPPTPLTLLSPHPLIPILVHLFLYCLLIAFAFALRFASSPLEFSALSSVYFHKGATHMADGLHFHRWWAPCRAVWNQLWLARDIPDLLRMGHPCSFMARMSGEHRRAEQWLPSCRWRCWSRQVRLHHQRTY